MEHITFKVLEFDAKETFGEGQYKVEAPEYKEETGRWVDICVPPNVALTVEVGGSYTGLLIDEDDDSDRPYDLLVALEARVLREGLWFGPHRFRVMQADGAEKDNGGWFIRFENDQLHNKMGFWFDSDDLLTVGHCYEAEVHPPADGDSFGRLRKAQRVAIARPVPKVVFTVYRVDTDLSDSDTTNGKYQVQVGKEVLWCDSIDGRVLKLGKTYSGYFSHNNREAKEAGQTYMPSVSFAIVEEAEEVEAPVEQVLKEGRFFAKFTLKCIDDQVQPNSGRGYYCISPESEHYHLFTRAWFDIDTRMPGLKELTSDVVYEGLVYNNFPSTVARFRYGMLAFVREVKA